MKKVIIIGGGVAGMTAGILCAERGLDCEIFERTPFFGGNLTGWRRGGAMIDNCMHWLTGTAEGTAMYDLWERIGMLGEGIPLFRNEAFFTSERNGERLSLWGDVDRAEREFSERFPDDRGEIRRFFATVRVLQGVLTGRATLGGLPAALRRVPDLLFYRRTTLSALSERFHHPLLRLLFTDYLGGEMSAAALLFAYANFSSGNGSLPAGGSVAAAERIRRRCESLGCVLHPSSPVASIAVRDGRAVGVRGEDGRFTRADFVIAACEPETTFGTLLPRERMPARMKKLTSSPGTPRFSSIHAAFLCDRDALVPFGTRIIDAPEFSVRSGGRLPVREYSHEPSFAPAGKTVLQTLVFQNEQECAEWIRLRRNDPAEYRARGDRICAQMTDAICRSMPAVAPSLKVLDFWTPATYHRYFGDRTGSYMTSAMTPQASLLRTGSRIPGLRQFALATQWQRAPGGLPTAARAGEAAARTAIRELGAVPEPASVPVKTRL